MPFLPFVDDFKLDAFGLDDSLEASISTVDVEFELLFKLWAVGVFHCAGFVPLSLLLHTNTHTHMNELIITHLDINRVKPSITTEED